MTAPETKPARRAAMQDDRRLALGIFRLLTALNLYHFPLEDTRVRSAINNARKLAHENINKRVAPVEKRISAIAEELKALVVAESPEGIAKGKALLLELARLQRRVKKLKRRK